MRVLLGVCGGIAAYKAAELTRELQRRGAEVQIVMTAGAERFVTPLTLATLSGRQVLRSLWDPAQSELAGENAERFEIEHIAEAQAADAVVIAPATANMIAKLAHGMADDLLSTICLATRAPVMLAPAMNVNMWSHAGTQENVERLRARGVRMIEPGSGELACGMVGAGRLAEPVEIADAVVAMVRGGNAEAEMEAARISGFAGSMRGEVVLITAGGTREPVDAVRFLGNRSSGRMGVALAEAALARGAAVVFVAAAMSVPVPEGCRRVDVSTAEEMREAVLRHLPEVTVVLMAAAISDYRVAAPAGGKMKKRATLTLELVQSADILREVAGCRRAETVVVGFAAETERVLEEGRRKLWEKGADLMVANDVSAAGMGFESDRNGGTILLHDREVTLPVMPKRAMAERILDEVVRLGAGRAEALELEQIS